MLFKYVILFDSNVTLHINGTIESDSMATAQQELERCGARIIDIRELNIEDIKLERLKQLRDSITGVNRRQLKVKPTPVKESWFRRFLRWYLNRV